MISYGAPKSCITVSGTNSPSPTKTLKKLKRPSRICGSAVNPRCASCAASTPLRAASPAWSGFVMVPKFCRNPPAFEAAIPSAIWTCGPVNRRRFAAAATAPRVPIAAVGCQPRRRCAEVIALPIFASTSTPITNAVITSLPLAPKACPSASTAGTTGTLGCPRR